MAVRIINNTTLQIIEIRKVTIDIKGDKSVFRFSKYSKKELTSGKIISMKQIRDTILWEETDGLEIVIE